MSYAIIRHNKLRSLAALGAVGMHNGRLKEEGNVDGSRSHLNRHIDGHGNKLEPGRGWLIKPVRDRLKELDVKVRSNAVLAIEVMMTTSPDWWEEFPEGSPERKARGAAWMREQVAYVKERFGADNVVAISLHLDEKTPHVHAVVMPLVQKIDRRSKSKEPKWKLDAFGAMGGGPKGVSEIVQNYGKRMQAAFGLEPGERAADRRGRGEDVKHVPIGVHQKLLQEERDKTAASTEHAEDMARIAEQNALDANRIKSETIALRIALRKEHEPLIKAAKEDRAAAAEAKAAAEHERTAAETARVKAQAEGRQAGEAEGRTAGRKAIEAELEAERKAAEKDRRKAAEEREAAERARQNAEAEARKAVEVELGVERAAVAEDRRKASEAAVEAARKRREAQVDREAAKTARNDAEALKSSWEAQKEAEVAEIDRQKRELEVKRTALNTETAQLKVDQDKLADGQEALERDRKQLRSDREALAEREAAFRAGVEAFASGMIQDAYVEDGMKKLDFYETVPPEEEKTIRQKIQPAFDAVWGVVNQAMNRFAEIAEKVMARAAVREKQAAENLKALDEATRARISPAVIQQIEAAPGASMSPEEFRAAQAALARLNGRGM